MKEQNKINKNNYAAALHQLLCMAFKKAFKRPDVCGISRSRIVRKREFNEIRNTNTNHNHTDKNST